MWIVIDLLLVALLAWLTFRGFKRGFFRSIFGLGRLILAVIITVIFRAPFSAWLDKTFINPPVFDAVHEKLTALGERAGGDLTTLLNSLPHALSAQLGGDPGGYEGNIDATVEQWSHSIAGNLSEAISSVIGTVLLFILAFLLLSVAVFFVSKLLLASPFAGIDRLLGAILGGVSGILAVILVAMVLAAVLTACGQQDIVVRSLLLRLFALQYC